MTASDFFSLPASLAAFAEHFPAAAAPWEWVARIGPALSAVLGAEERPASVPPGVRISGMVRLHPTVRLPAYAVISGPVWIGPDCEIRAGAQIRGPVIAGARCVLGGSGEYKNCLLLDQVETAHFNYVGDSVLGNRAHLGAGAVCSNLRLDRAPIVIRGPDRNYDTGLRKLGAILGDQAEVGCNAVLNPGTLLGPRSLVMPAMAFGGFLPADSMARLRQSVAVIPRPGA